jgi:hypothetical protein
MLTLRYSRSVASIVAALASLVSSLAYAAPIFVSRSDFSASTIGTSSIVETFQSFPTNQEIAPVNPFGPFVTAPFTINVATGTYTANRPYFIDAASSFAAVGVASIMLANNQPDLDVGRTFGGFAAGSTLFGIDLYQIRGVPLNQNDILVITVVGSSGVLSAQRTMAQVTTGSNFLGFFDAAGLVSVTFRNIGSFDPMTGEFIGRANYYMDNATTAAISNVVSVPEPLTV